MTALPGLKGARDWLRDKFDAEAGPAPWSAPTLRDKFLPEVPYNVLGEAIRHWLLNAIKDIIKAKGAVSVPVTDEDGHLTGHDYHDPEQMTLPLAIAAIASDYGRMRTDAKALRRKAEHIVATSKLLPKGFTADDLLARAGVTDIAI